MKQELAILQVGPCHFIPLQDRQQSQVQRPRTFSEKESLNSIFIWNAPMKPEKEKIPMMANMV